jgi:PAS domain S-box-containing protein
MDFLDIKTIIFIQLLIQFICVGMLAQLWRHNRGRYAGLELWLAGSALQAACLALILMRGILPNLVSMVAGNTIGLYGMMMFNAGLNKFAGLPRREKLNWALLAVFAAVHSYFSLVLVDYRARNINFNFFMLLFSLSCARALRFYPESLRRLGRSVRYSFYSIALLSLARLLTALFVGSAPEFFYSYAPDTALLVVYTVVVVGLTFSLFLMVNSRLQADTLADSEGRLKAEKELRDSAQRLEFALASAGMGFWQLDLKHNSRDFDERTCALLGIDYSSFRGTPDEFFAAVHPEDRQLLSDAMARTIEKDSLYSPEYRVLLKDGTVRNIAARGRLRRDEEGRPWLLDGLVWDITEKKKAEEAMLSAQKLESLGTLAGGIAHDFNNLLTGITGNLSLIRRTCGTAGESGELTAEAESACITAKGLARQLLTFASGGEPVKAPLDICALAREGFAFSLHGTAVKAAIECEDGLRVLGDRDQLFQVVQNLAINAAQAMPSGGTVNVKVRKAELKGGELYQLPAGPYARLDVKDSGPGIPRETLARMFDPYFSTKGHGRGLGLAVCRSIVGKHGGAITVESEPGRGALFSVYLPATDKPEAARARTAPAGAKACGRVLIMDDEEVVYKALRRMLTALGYEAEVALNGEQALLDWQAAAAAGKKFCAVIMDLTIAGGMGGVEAVKRLKALDPSAKVIVSSGYAEDPVMARYAEYGFDRALCKPYQVDDLARLLGDLLG